MGHKICQRDCLVTALLAMTTVWTACGGGSSGGMTPGTVAPSGATGAGRIALKVTGARSFNPNIIPGQVTQYVVTVSGEGFTPIQTTVAGDATETTVDGIPTGEHRMVHVAAMNPNGQKIREGEAVDVMVPNDSVAEVPLAMQAVPIITNVAEGAHVANTRLRFSIFSDPATIVELTAATGEKSEALTDVVENRPTVATDAATGLAAFVPPKLATGEYLLTVFDSKTGRKSQVTIVVTDGGKERGAPLVSGGWQRDRRGVMQTGGVIPAPPAQRAGMNAAFLGMRLE